MTGLAWLTVRERVAEPVPVALVAERVIEKDPVAVGVPEMTPLEAFTASPAGRPEAAKLVGELVAVIE